MSSSLPTRDTNNASGLNMERRRADTLGAPDRKRSRLALSETEGESSSSSRMAGSSFAMPIDITSSSPSPPQRHPDNDTPRSRPAPASSSSQWSPSDGTDYMEYVRPRWQPDEEVDECPICEVPFSFWYRKHHCRKCGRVVCASCSPHRITIPRQYIVRPPEVHRASVSATFIPTIRASSEGDEDTAATASPTAINPALGGGEEVRLCNPCVPDPNPEPPRVFVQPNPPRHRSYHSMSVPRQRSSYGVGMGESSSRPGRRTVGSNDYPCFGGLGNLFGASGSYQERPSSRFGSLPSSSSSSQQRPLPSIRDTSTRPSRRRQVDERDLCPICNYQFLPLNEGSTEESREAHIRDCIENHGPRARSSSQAVSSGTGTGRTGPGPAIQPQPLPVRMVAFTATEKDCLGHDTEAQECTICMEEYEVGQPLVRLECLCKFHKRCIVEWFERKKECPVHKS